LEQDVCVGEIATGHNNSKHLIDTSAPSPCFTLVPAEARKSGNLPNGRARNFSPSGMAFCASVDAAMVSL